jgi:hypothetical protein
MTDHWGDDYRDAYDFSDGVHDHHIFPQEFEGYFVAAGIDMHEWTVTLAADYHLDSIHPSWNDDWRDFFESDAFLDVLQSGSEETLRAAVENHAAEVLEKYDIYDGYLHSYREYG